MRLLPTLVPDMHQELDKGNHAVRRSEQSFFQIWTDMALP